MTTAPEGSGRDPEVDRPESDVDVGGQSEASDQPRRKRAAVRHHLWRPFSLFGCFGALVFFCVSMTPSLLPRPWYLQSVATGVSLIVGYLIGVLLAWLYLSLGFTEPGRRLRHGLWLVVGALTAILVPVFCAFGMAWESEIHAMIGTREESGWLYLPMMVLSLAIALVLLAVARAVRWVSRTISRIAARWIPKPAAKALGVIVVAVTMLLLVTDTLLPTVRSALNESFGLVDTSTPSGVVPPTTPLRSGGPGSLAAWDTLGYEGRAFVAGGPTVAEIADLTGEPALQPIRAYAGLDSADDLEAGAEVVVAELNRTGAFDRSVLVVATTTGRGWVNPTSAAVVEYMWGGDTAIAALQYSFFPSPVAFIADTATPPLAGRILFRAVHRAWSQRPADDRPALYVMGESLGSYGSQGAFGSVEDLDARADGALWSGTPNLTGLWQEITADRDSGSPQSVPVLQDCEQVCFVDRSATIPEGATPTIVYIQHPTDAVVWWDANLLFTEPDWLTAQDRHGISRHMRWYPFVTFWQTTVDMALAGDAPDGFGHHYGADLVDAWALLTGPPGWTPERNEALRDRVSGILRE